MALYPLPKQYSVDFSNPRKKPIDDVQIDWNNSISRGLVGCWIFNRSSLNLAGGMLAEIQGDPIYLPGKGVEFDGSADMFAVPYSAKFEPQKLTVISKQTIYTGGGAAQNSVVMPFDNVGSPSFVSYSFKPAEGTTSSFIEFGISGSIRKVNVSAFISRDVPQVWGFSHDGVDATSYMGGANIDTQAGVGALQYSGLDTLNFGASKTGNSHFNGNIEYVYIWNRVLTDAEHALISKSPSIILKPKSPPVYFTVDAATGLTVSPTGIPSSEAFGSVTLLQPTILNMSGIPSSEIFGTPSIQQPNNITMSGIPSSEAFGNASVIVQKILTMTGIPSSSFFGKLALTGDAIVIKAVTGIIKPIVSKIVSSIVSKIGK